MRFVSLFLLFGLSAGATAQELWGEVVHVTDGDTILIVDNQDRREFVRIAAIDAPEKKRREMPAQPYSQRSRQHLTKLVKGKRVRLASQGRDDYKRIVARVWLDGLDVGLEQVCNGYAWVFDRFVTEFAQADQETYRNCEERARMHKKGLWRGKRPLPPWVWRYTHRARGSTR